MLVKDALKNISEGELVDKLIKQDRQAMEYLYDHYSAALYGVITRIVHTEEVAEEVLQDSFIKIWSKIPSYDSKKGKLFTWMLNISRNLAIDKVRSKEFKSDQKTDQVENNVSNIERKNYINQEVDNIGIKELLKYLTEEQQLIVDLLYFRGYTQTEVSKEFNIPLGTVKTRLRAALLELRKIVN